MAVVLCKGISNTMRDKHYPNRSIRLADKIWLRFKNQRRLSGLSWNLFIKSLMKTPMQNHANVKGQKATSSGLRARRRQRRIT